MRKERTNRMNLCKLLDFINDIVGNKEPKFFDNFSLSECEKLADMMHRHVIIYEKCKNPIIFLMIGTNRVMFDSLAPKVGSRLIEAGHSDLTIFGTMEHPVHALNLDKTIKEIYKTYPNAFIIAIDASLGVTKNIGKVTFSPNPLQPGIGVGKALPEAGNISICGIVGTPSKSGFPENEISEQGLETMVDFIATSCLLFYHKFSCTYSCMQQKKG